MLRRPEWNLSISSNPSPYLSFKGKTYFHLKAVCRQVPAHSSCPESSLGRRCVLGPGSVLPSPQPPELSFSGLLRKHAGPLAVFQLLCSGLRTEAVACHLAGRERVCQRGRVGAKHSRAVQQALLQQLVFICWENAGPRGWVSSGPWNSLVWQNLLLEPHAKVIFGFQRGAPQ